MKKKRSSKIFRCVIVVALFAVIFLPANAAQAQNKKTKRQIIDSSIQYLRSQIDENGVVGKSQSLTEWSAIALAASQKKVNKKVVRAVTLYKPKVKDGSSEIARHILALEALSKDSHNNRGVNFVKRLKNTRKNKQFGDLAYVNDDIFSVLALIASGEAADSKPLQRTLAHILKAKNGDGGVSYAVSAETSDVDTTASFVELIAALEAQGKLSEKLIHAKNKAIKYLLKSQNTDGGWGYAVSATSNASSTAWVLQAIVAMGKDNTRAAERGYDYLTSLRSTTGAFLYDAQNSWSSDVWNTAYALMAFSHQPLPIIR